MTFKVGDRVRFTAVLSRSRSDAKGWMGRIIDSETYRGLPLTCVFWDNGQVWDGCRSDNLEKVALSPFEQSVQDYIDQEYKELNGV